MATSTGQLLTSIAAIQLRAARTMLWVFVAVAVLGFSSAAMAAKKLALVIGNDAYTEVEPLARAVADARAYKKLLEEERGFDVFYAENADRVAMNTMVAEFLSAIEPGDVAMVVYSGHGVQLDAERRDSLFLLPIDFPDRDPGPGAERHFFNSESLNFARLAENVAARGAKLRLFVLDACRNNPFNRAEATRTIGVSRGIGRINSARGEFVIYAAAPGEVAFDSLPGDAPESVNSVFTRAFIKYFREGTYLEDVANDVQAEVVTLARAANVEQEPYYSDGVAGRTCLEENCGAAADATALTVIDAEREKTFWGYCEAKDEPAYCQAYLDAYPTGWRAPLARARLTELTGLPGKSVDDPGKRSDGDKVAVTPIGEATVRDATPTKLPLTGPGADGTAVTVGESAEKTDASSSETTGDDTAVAALDPEKVKNTDEVAGLSRAALRDTQARLAILGHRPGGLDGLMGKRTRSAITAFQKDVGLTPDGRITNGLLARLASAVPGDALDAFYRKREAAAAKAARERAARRAARESAARDKTKREPPRNDRQTGPTDAERAAAARAAAEAAKRDEARRAELARQNAAKAQEEARAAEKTTGGTGIRLRDSGAKPAYCTNLWARDKDECR